MFADSFKKLAKTNTNFRQVLYTGQYSQVVAMSIPAGDDIGEEVHPTNDQIFVIATGSGEAVVGDETRQVGKKDIVFVPAGTLHNVKNIGDEALKLITIYSPPAHPDGTVEATKDDAKSEATIQSANEANTQPVITGTTTG